MNRRQFMILAGNCLVAAAGVGCASLDEMWAKDPIGMLQSAGKIGSAALDATKEITEEQEIYLGRSVSARILTQYKWLNNQRLHKYINLVGTSVAMASERPDLHYHFAVLNTKEVNAFAAPGGFIFITLGMVRSMKDEEELAAILGHEIGHCAARHSMKSIKSDLWKKVAVITAQETARHQGVNPQLLDLFNQATDKVVGTLVTVGYEQGMEFEADKFGQAYCTLAGYKPDALRTYLEQMEKRAKGKDKTLAARLGTHPTFEARLAKLPPAEQLQPSASAINYRKKRFRSAIR